MNWKILLMALIMTLIAVFMFLAIMVCAKADEIDTSVCFADAYGVRRHSPEAWPSYTLRMPGHRGERCWYPSTKENAHKHWRKEVMHIVRTKSTRTHDARPRSARLPTGATSYGSARPTIVFDRAAKVKLFMAFEEWQRAQRLNGVFGVK